MLEKFTAIYFSCVSCQPNPDFPKGVLFYAGIVPRRKEYRVDTTNVAYPDHGVHNLLSITQCTTDAVPSFRKSEQQSRDRSIRSYPLLCPAGRRLRTSTTERRLMSDGVLCPPYSARKKWFTHKAGMQIPYVTMISTRPNEHGQRDET